MLKRTFIVDENSRLFFDMVRAVLAAVEPDLEFDVESGQRFNTDFSMTYKHLPTGLTGAYPVSRAYIQKSAHERQMLALDIVRSILQLPLWVIFPNSRNGLTQV